MNNDMDTLRDKMLADNKAARQKRFAAELWLFVFSGFTLAGLFTSSLILDILGAVLPAIVFTCGILENRMNTSNHGQKGV